MIGYEGTPPGPPWNPEKIATALNWFMEHEKGVYLEALLQHYGTIDTSYPRTIDIAPSVFVDLHLLYSSYWDIIALYGSAFGNVLRTSTRRNTGSLTIPGLEERMKVSWPRILTLRIKLQPGEQMHYLLNSVP